MNSKKTLGIVLIMLLFIGGIAGGYFYFSTMFPKEKAPEEAGRAAGEQFFLRVYYPVDNQIQIEERRPPRRSGLMAVAEATMEEYLKGPAGGKSTSLPKNARLLGVYKGADRILYIDLSGEFRRNFQGDAFAEFLLLKSLYESLISNVEDIQDVKVLIDGKEAETLGGHLYLLYPLKDIVTYGY
ncbi:MAG: hypothetical protein E4H45_01640 [Nitrospirales bacterium]|nr:MAG: hypothetical protein E4H45_01640 [Nitrospirales bacterium]